MNMIKYKISVIIPVYNAEKYLKTAIESVINQTIGFENIELIIVNDNSNDNSKKIIEDYANKYKNIIDIHLDENSGLPGKPRNIGIEYATAPYIIFLDADDEYLPHAFELYYNTIISEKSDFVMGSHYWNMDGDKHKIEIIHDCDDKSDIITINPMLNEKNFDICAHYHVAPWGKIFNKKVIIEKNIRFLEDALSEDTYFFYKTLINSKKITFLQNDILYIYNVYDSNESTIHTHNLKTFNDFFNGSCETLKLLENVHYSKKYLIGASISSLLLLFSNLTINEKKESIDKLYKLEKYVNEENYVLVGEVKLLKNEILKKHYTRAIILSEIYSFLYNNKILKKLYRKFR